jgi:xanthine dehydrogenase accessory factor
VLEGKNVLVLGAGDLATGVVRRLRLAGARVVATELPAPLTVRRLASFSEAVWEGRHEVEGATAVRCAEEDVDAILGRGEIPLLVDPEGAVRKRRRFDVLVDARMAKRNLGTAIGDAPVVIAIGPGFAAGRDCHAVVETLQGAGMGRAIFEGGAASDTGEPCSLSLAGANPDPGLPAENRVLRAPADGAVRGLRRIGDLVEAGEAVAEVSGTPVVSTFRGVLRGLVRDGVRVPKGLKIGEVDLTGKAARCRRVSEKANAVAGGVLEACFVLLRRGE